MAPASQTKKYYCLSQMVGKHLFSLSIYLSTLPGRSLLHGVQTTVRRWHRTPSCSTNDGPAVASNPLTWYKRAPVCVTSKLLAMARGRAAQLDHLDTTSPSTGGRGKIAYIQEPLTTMPGREECQTTVIWQYFPGKAFSVMKGQYFKEQANYSESGGPD